MSPQGLHPLQDDPHKNTTLFRPWLKHSLKHGEVLQSHTANFKVPSCCCKTSRHQNEYELKHLPGNATKSGCTMGQERPFPALQGGLSLWGEPSVLYILKTSWAWSEYCLQQELKICLLISSRTL